MKGNVDFSITVFCLCISWFSFAQTGSVDYVKGEVLFKIKDNSSVDFPVNKRGTVDLDIHYNASDALARFLIDRQVLELQKPAVHIGLNNLYLAHFNNKENIDTIIQELKRMQIIEYAEKNLIFPAENEPISEMVSYSDRIRFNKSEELNSVKALVNDPLYNGKQQWSLDKIGAPFAWDASKGDSIIICIIDEGFQLSHPNLASKNFKNTKEIPNNGLDDDNNGFKDDVNGWDFAYNDNDVNYIASVQDQNGPFHGIHVCGIAGGATNNTDGMASTGYNARLLTIKVGADKPQGSITISVSAVVFALDYAVKMGASVVNMSFGFTSFVQSVQDACTAAYNKGVFLVSTAGNSSYSLDLNDRYPGECANVLNVANVDSNDVKGTSSNWGANVDISAPGSSILSSVPTWITGLKIPSYNWVSGTSMAAPHVAATVALMQSVNRKITNAQIETCLKTKAEYIDGKNPTYSGKLGVGRLNTEKAVICAQSLITTVDTKSTIRVEKYFPNPASNELNCSFTMKRFGKATILITDVLGRMIRSENHEVKKGDNLFSLGLSELKAGIYFLHIISGNEQLQVQFVKGNSQY